MRGKVREMQEEVSQLSAVPSPATTTEALGMLRRPRWDTSPRPTPPQLAAATQAECLQILEQVTAMGTAARTSILAAFTSGQGYSRGCGLQPAGLADQPDPDHQGRRGRPNRVGPPGRRAPFGRDALAAGEVSESFARTMCQWTDKLPEDCREGADTI